MLDFTTFSIGHLENIVSLRCADFPNIHTFYYTLSKKSHSLLLAQVPSAKSLTISEAVKLMVVDEESEKAQNLHVLGESYFLINLLWDGLFIVLLNFIVER